MRTFIATATDLQGRSIRRQVQASDKKDALSQLRGLGLTSIRLHEVLLPADTRQASVLRPSSAVDSGRDAPEAQEAPPVPQAPPSRPLRRLCEDTIRVEILETDATVVRHSETRLPRGDDGPARPRRGPQDTLEVEVEETAAPAPRPQLPPGPRETPPHGRETRPMGLPSRETRPIPRAPQETRPLPTSGRETRAMAAPRTERLPRDVPDKALAPLSEGRSLSLLPMEDLDDEPVVAGAQWNAVDALARVRKAARPVDLERARLSAVDRMSFFSALANMLTVGIPMLRAIASMQEQFSDPVTRAVMAEVCRRLGDGCTLSDAMASMPRVFTKLQIGSVRGGEKSGKLALVLERLYRYEERTLSLTRQLKAVLTYPLVVFGCSLVLVMFVGRSLVTGMSPALTQAGVQVNAVTRMVMAMAQALDRPLVATMFLAACGGLVWLAARWLATPTGQERRDRFVMRAPMLRNPLRMVETSRICEAMSALYGSGLTLLQCLEVATDACGNVVAREALTVVRGDLREGRSLSEGLARSGFFDKTVVHMVAVGEEAGRLDMAFVKVAQYNDLEVRSALDQFAAAIEPLMFVVLGVVVGIIALVAFGPLYQLMGALT